MPVIIHKIFTKRQLTYFFQIAIIINIIGLLLDIIVYRYFPDCIILQLICENLSNMSIFIVCLIIISQALLIFIKNHQTLVHRYKLAAIALGISISTFFMLILTTDNDVQENFIIYISKISRADDSNKAIIALLTIFIFLLYNLYHTLTKPDRINDASVPQTIRSIFRLVITEYILLESSLSFLSSEYILKKYKKLKKVQVPQVVEIPSCLLLQVQTCLRLQKRLLQECPEQRGYLEQSSRKGHVYLFCLLSILQQGVYC